LITFTELVTGQRHKQANLNEQKINLFDSFGQFPKRNEMRDAATAQLYGQLCSSMIHFLLPVLFEGL